LSEASVGPVLVVESLVLAQSVQQVVPIPNQGTVEQFAAAGLIG
jgi:hypothetical protein